MLQPWFSEPAFCADQNAFTVRHFLSLPSSDRSEGEEDAVAQFSTDVGVLFHHHDLHEDARRR